MKKSFLSLCGAFISGVVLTAIGYHVRQLTRSSLQAIDKSTEIKVTRQTAGPAPAINFNPSAETSQKLKLLFGNASDEIADCLLLDAWAKKDAQGLRKWLIAIPDSVTKRKRLLYIGMLSLAGNDVNSLYKLVGEWGALFSDASVLSVPEQVDILSRLSKDQTQALELEKNPAEPKIRESILQRAEILREVHLNGFDAALTSFCNNKQTGEVVVTQAMELFKNIPDSSPDFLSRVYEQLNTSYWWGNDNEATYAATLELAKFNPEMATKETLKLDGIVGDTASPEAYRAWSRIDPKAALEFLPNSGILDKNRQINFLNSIAKTTKDADILLEVNVLLGDLQK